MDVAFSSDGQHIASASLDAVQLWNIATHEQVQLISHWLDIYWLRFSADGSCLVTSMGPLQLSMTLLSDESRNENTSTACLVGVAKQWITYDSVKLILLPREHDMMDVATFGKMLALGLWSGQVRFFAFDSRSRRPWVSTLLLTPHQREVSAESFFLLDDCVNSMSAIILCQQTRDGNGSGYYPDRTGPDQTGYGFGPLTQIPAPGIYYPPSTVRCRY
jgi:hypothetical protein